MTDLGPGGGGGGPVSGGGGVPPQQERGFLEQLVCSLCSPICKEFGIDLEQIAGGGQPGAPQETVHLNQPGRERIHIPASIIISNSFFDIFCFIKDFSLKKNKTFYLI